MLSVSLLDNKTLVYILMVYFFIFFHQKYCLKSLYIVMPPRCTEYRVLWAFSKIFFLNSTFFGTHRWFWNRKVQSSCTINPGDFPISRLRFILWSSGSFFWFTRIFFTMEGYKVSADNWTLACPCDTNWITQILELSQEGQIVITFVFKLCCDFLLKSSPTRFAFPGWHWIRIS